MTRRKELEHDKALHDLASKAKKKDAKLKTLLTQNLRLQKEVDAALSIVQSAKTHAIRQKTGGGKSEAVAVAVASDWHVEEEVRAATVNGLNKYNLDIAKSRANRFFERTVRLVRKEQQDVEIKTLCLILGGDFVTGRIHEENLETCLLRPIDAIIYAQELIESGIRFLLSNTELDIVVPCVVGNHSRITRKVHSGTEQGNSLETMMYHALKKRFKDEKRIVFVIADGYHLYMPTYNNMLRIHHGHAVNYGGGVGGLTIPLNKALAQWNLSKRVDMDIVGWKLAHLKSLKLLERP